jgi:hypothetical protein
MRHPHPDVILRDFTPWKVLNTMSSLLTMQSRRGPLLLLASLHVMSPYAADARRAEAAACGDAIFRAGSAQLAAACINEPCNDGRAARRHGADTLIMRMRYAATLVISRRRVILITT